MSESTATEISGYDLAVHLLAKGGVNALLEYARHEEKDWLELKRGMGLSDEDLRKGETQKDLYSKYAQEIIALANTAGGAFVIGIEDETLSLKSLSEYDPQHKIKNDGLLDDYIRDFVRQNLWPATFKWTFRNKPWELSNKSVPVNLLSWQHAPYRDPEGREGEVIVVLVRPFEKPQLTIVEGKYSSLLKRRDGDVGEAEPFIYDIEKITDYRSSRKAMSSRFAAIRDKFDADCKRNDSRHKLNEAIRDYYERLKASAKERMSAFTPLDASESFLQNESANAFFSPDATELLEDDDDWLKDDEGVDGGDAPDGSDVEDENDYDDDAWVESAARPARQGGLLDILGDEKRIVVSGEPGGGKTTCLQYFALQFSRWEPDAEPVLALFIPMGQWGRACSLERMMAKVSGLQPGQLTQLAAENRLRLVIDAVNECPDKLRPAAIQGICSYLLERPGLPAVISTRDAAELKDFGLPVFWVQPMDEAHRLRYLERYLGDRDQAERLMAQIMAMPGGEAMAENPMLLRLVVEVYRDSPLRSLPSGRAGLYRRSLQGWHKREVEKRSKAKLPSRWNVSQMVEILSELAYRSRLNGYRDVPLDFVRELWGGAFDERLQGLCQGPVVYHDEKFVSFRHETFQEYLCAEFMISSGEPLPEWSSSDYSRWGMPMAYAYELLESGHRKLPDGLWLKAWELNPWMGVAITESAVGEQIRREAYHGVLPLVDGKILGSHESLARAGMVYIEAMAACFRPRVILAALAGRLCQSWYRKTDSALGYLVSVTEKCRSRWAKMESAQLDCLKDLKLEAALVLARNWLSLRNPREIFQTHAPESWERWVSMPDPTHAKELLDARLALPEDIEAAKRLWVQNVSLGKAIQLGRRHMLSAADVAERIPQWIKLATREQAIAMIRLEWCSPRDFSAWIPRLMSGAGVRTLVNVVKERFATPSDVHDRAIELMREINAAGIEELHGVGILTLAECHDRLLEIKAKGLPEDAAALIRLGVASVGEFSGRNAWWFEHATPETLAQLVKDGFALQDDIEARITQLVASATPSTACKMIGNRLATVEDFRGRLSAWADVDQYEAVAEFVERYDDADVRNRFAHSVGRWIANATALSAARLVRDGFATGEDFKNRLPWWKETEGIQVWREFLSCELVSQREFNDHDELCRSVAAAGRAVTADRTLTAEYAGRIADWTNAAPLSCVGQLIRVGLTSAESYARRCSEWISMAGKDVANCIVLLKRNHVITLSEAQELARPLVDDCSVLDAVCLCGESILLSEEFSVRKKAWISDISVGDAVRLVNLGILSPDDVDSRVSEWVSESTPKAASWLFRAGIVQADAFCDRIPAWKGEWTLLDAARLINDGIVSSEDVADDPSLAEYCRNRTVRGVVRLVTADGAEIDVDGTTVVLPKEELRTLQGENALRAGEEYEFDLIDNRAADFVLSRWNVLKRQALQRMDVGKVYEGVVREIDSRGARISFGCIGGYLSVDDMSCDRNVDPHELLRIGQRVEVKVLEKYLTRLSMSLGLKQLVPMPPSESPVSPEQQNSPPVNPSVPTGLRQSSLVPNPLGVQGDMAKRFSSGLKVHGTVIKVLPYGAFVKIAPYVTGLVHVSEMSWTRRVKNASDEIAVGAEVDAVILGVDSAKNRMTLSIRQAKPNPWDSVSERFPVGLKVRGKVVNVVKFGAFVELADGFDGLLHVSEMGISGISDDPGTYYYVGQEVEVVVKSVDGQNRRIALGLADNSPRI